MIRREFTISDPHEFAAREVYSVFEWVRLYIDLHPVVASMDRTVAGQEERLRYLGVIPSPQITPGSIPGGPRILTKAQGKCARITRHIRASRKESTRGSWAVDTAAHYGMTSAVYQELAEDIQTGRLEPKRRVYLDDRRGELDPTLCVLDAVPILKIAERRGDGGVIIRKLLAERRQPVASASALASPRRRGQYLGALNEWLAPKHIDILRRTSPDALARDFKLYCERERQEVLPLLPKRLRSMEPTIEQIIERRVNAVKSRQRQKEEPT
jgi:hypothetical protein